MKTFLRLGAICAVSLVMVLGNACSTNSQGDEATPVFLEVNFQLLPAIKNVAVRSLLQFDNVQLTSVIKNPGAGSSNFLDTRIDDYVIEWRRIDGGTKASATEVFAGNVVVPAGGTSTLSNYPFMGLSAVQDPPLDQLLPFNGGLDRETGRSEIRQEGKVTFRGRTFAGNEVRGVGIFNMTFIYSPVTGKLVPKISEPQSRKNSWALSVPSLAFVY